MNYRRNIEDTVKELDYQKPPDLEAFTGKL